MGKINHRYLYDTAWLLEGSDMNVSSEEPDDEVVECLTRDREFAGLSISGRTALCP